MVSSISNKGVWDKVVVAWVDTKDKRTLATNVEATLNYQQMSRSFNNRGCIWGGSHEPIAVCAFGSS